MADLTSRLEYLVSGFAADQLSAAELDELLALIPGDDAGDAVLTSVEQALYNHTGPLLLTAEAKQTLLEQIIRRKTAPEQAPSLSSRAVHRIHFLKTAWFRSVAAAILILIIGSVAYIWNIQNKKETHSLVQTDQPVPVNNDVAAPSNNRAIITLSGGEQITLDSAINGTLAVQGNVSIRKTNDGRIIYDGRNNEGAVQYNTLTVPRGSQIASIVLADGSKVFLNAASSLRYPISFDGKDRRVSITGEAYFEVAKNARKPFIVETVKETITVLGTHFNINAYAEEASIKTSLLEGSIKIAGKVLKPGEAFIDGKIIKSNLDQDVAWKNGFFSFHATKLPEAMRQLSRWYDVQISYEGIMPTVEFGGEMGRNLTLQQVLRGLQDIDDLRFRLDGKTITVSKA